MVHKPLLSSREVIKFVKDGDTVMVGGFLGCGTPLSLIGALVEQGTKDMTLICNDTAIYNPKQGISNGVVPLVINKQFKRIITSHIGLNPETQRQMNASETEVVLVPQGTLAEQIRAAGAGLGGVITPTGVGTEVQEGKQLIEIDGKQYLVEKPLKADVALIQAWKADKAGNLIYANAARNFNPLMATAAKLVIVETQQIVEIGEIDPQEVITPSIFVDYLVSAN